MTEIRRAPSGIVRWSTRLPAEGEPLSICTSTISRFSLRSSSRWMSSCSGTSCSTSAITAEVAQIAGEGEDDVGGPGDPGALEHVQLRRVAVLDLVLELLLELEESAHPLLDQRHFVTHPVQRPRDVRADLAPTRYEHVHHETSAFCGIGTSQERTASVRTSIAVFVGQTVRRPRAASK